MSDPRDIYPLSTIDGKGISLDVIDPVKYIEKSFTTSPTTSVALPSGNYIIALRADVGCYVKFGIDVTDAVAVPSNGVAADNVVYVPSDMQIIVYPYNKFYSVVGEAAGKLRMQFIQQWHGLTTLTAINRG